MASTAKPLNGKRVLVTRPQGQSAELSDLLRQAGARVLAVPAIRIRPPSDPKPLREAARRCAEGGYDWIVFTSPNAVRRFFRYCKGEVRARFAAIGPKTGEALRERGVRVAPWPEEHRAEALEASLRAKPGDRVLLPRAAVARDALPDRLRRRGVVVDVVEAYRTEPDGAASRRLRRLLLDTPPDWVTFTSSSTAESLRALFDPKEWKNIFRSARAASIGPITSSTLRRLGVRPAVEARPSTAKGLARAIREFRT